MMQLLCLSLSLLVSFLSKVAVRVRIVEFCVMFAQAMVPVFSCSIVEVEVVEQHQS